MRARRVVVLVGPRQAGKTTLARQYLVDQPGGTLLRLDDPLQLDAVRADPRRALQGPRPVVVDEVQRGGDELVRHVKLAVDDERNPGQFLLTGSSNFLTVPTISESLAGRAAFLTLWPLTNAEVQGATTNVLDRLFDEPQRLVEVRGGAGLSGVVDRLVRGGYPEAVSLDASDRRQWYEDYLTTTIQRDVVELSGLRRSPQLRRLLSSFGARTSQELVMENIARDVDLSRQTLYDYRAWLSTIHLVHELPAWSGNLSRRLRKRPKVVITDSGLAVHLVGRTGEALLDGDHMLGPLIETFVTVELLRHAAISDQQVQLFHYRDASGGEVDLVLERADGRVVGVEIKATSTPRSRDARHLARLRDDLDAAGGHFAHGVVLHTGPKAAPLGDRLTAVPIDFLWS